MHRRLALTVSLVLATPLLAQGPRRGPIDWDAARQHWAFVPVPERVPAPAVADASWPADDLDRFVLARLEAAELGPAPPADRRTWIRRVTLDLTGLPPTYDEVEAFVADRAADARERVVDRLLASPAYGERQARMWLDLARYSDSNGLDENLALGNAWRYRDWVVRAMNDDLPFDEFVTMQIAGDLMPPTDDEQLAVDRLCATGFLALGPKVLAEQDKQKLTMDIIDEQIDVLTKATLGLTVSCARCHDHKFDPVPARDYYALAGILKSTGTMENLDHVSRWREVELATPAQRRARDAWVAESDALDRELAAATAAGERAIERSLCSDLARYLLAGTAAAGRATYVEAEAMVRSNLKADAETWGSAATQVVHTAVGGRQRAEWEFDLPAGGTFELQVRLAAKESRPVRLWLNDRAIADDALAETTGDWFPKDQRWFTVVATTWEPGRNVLRLERDGAVPHIDKWCVWPTDAAADATLAPELVRAVADFVAHPARAGDPVFGIWHAFAALRGEDFAARAAALCDDLRAGTFGGDGAPAPLAAGLVEGLPPRSLRELAARYQAAFQVVDRAWRRALEADATALADPDQEQLRAAVLGPDGVFGSRGPLAEDSLPPEHRAQLAALRARRAALDARRPPAYPSALGVVDGAAVDVPVHLRGDHLNLAAEPTPRGTLQLFDHVVPAPEVPAGQSGRLELARWICDPRHPLTARVIVNRIWLTHFGDGLCRSPSNFGPRGEPPTHPALLDHLARTFVDGGWSMKALHRRIVLSRTYRTSSRGSDAARAVDPENRLLAHYPRRRLSADGIRDGILLVAGTLDRTLGGSLLETPNRGYVTNDQSADQGRYDTPRRSLYLPLIRNAVYDQFTLFDFGDPSVSIAHRPQTAVPIQALWLMNSETVHAQALAFARRVLAEVPDDPRARIDRAFRHAYARPATEAEIDSTARYVEVTRAGLLAATADGQGADPASADEHAWAMFCQVLFASNEFLHID